MSNRTQEEVLHLLNHTNQNLFITGGAGVGKSYVVNKWRETQTREQLCVAAPTGVAALHVQGSTLHRLFNIPFSIADIPYQSKISASRMAPDKKAYLRNIETLLIDEISMTRSDILSFVDHVLQHVRGDYSPWGGVRLICVGDPYQLPPVVAKHEAYKIPRPWFFQSEAWDPELIHTCNLTKMYRQEEGSQFASILNRIRIGRFTMDDIKVLNAQKATTPDPQAMVVATTNQVVAEINQENLDLVDAEEHVFTMNYKNHDPYYNIEKTCPAEMELRIKVGARVMILINGPGYANGSLGTIEKINDKLSKPHILVKLDNGRMACLERFRWTAEDSSYSNDKLSTTILGEATQFPIKLGYAVTVHKSQGMTFPKMHFVANRIFERGQAYVALSRATDLEGLTIKGYLSNKLIITDPDVKQFMQGGK